MAEVVPDEAKELRLVNNVELKIALADTDPKLQRLLNLYLPPLLMKLGSPHASVRNKVGHCELLPRPTGRENSTDICTS
jgi:proteasome component ECM29